jgi:hypothetical protein
LKNFRLLFDSDCCQNSSILLPELRNLRGHKQFPRLSFYAACFNYGLFVILQQFHSNYLAQGFGLRFGERKSEAEAERRRERSRSETTVAEPQAERPPIIRHLKCRS